MSTPGCSVACPIPAMSLLSNLPLPETPDWIVTHNVRHFVEAERVGIAVLTPREF